MGGCCSRKKPAAAAPPPERQNSAAVDEEIGNNLRNATMLFESSGRSGFDLVRLGDDEKSKALVPDVEVMKRMLHRENELRLSSETQRLLTREFVTCSLRLARGCTVLSLCCLALSCSSRR